VEKLEETLLHKVLRKGVGGLFTVASGLSGVSTARKHPMPTHKALATIVHIEA
jgi:hypothetical protein